jgi:hypothetical protein
LFAALEGMKWNHLPAPGGLYGQSPQFLDDLDIIFAIKNNYERQQRKEQEQKMAAQTKRGRSRMRR